MTIKKIFLPLLIMFVMLTTVVVNAMYDFSAEVIMPKFIEGKVIHDPAVNNVSASDRNLNVKVTVKLGDYSAASNPELLYYFDDDKDNVTTVSLETEVYKNQPFYIQTGKFESGHTSINYQIRVKFNTRDHSREGYAYWPLQDETTTSSDTFHRASISNSTSTVVGADGGTFEFDSGDQEGGNVTVVLDPGAVEPGTEIEIGEISFEDLFGGLFSPSMSLYPAVSYASAQTPYGDTINIGLMIDKNNKTSDAEVNGAKIAIPLKEDTVAKKFVVRYMSPIAVANKDFESSVVVKIIKVDFDDPKYKYGVVWANAPRLGYYLLFPSTDLSDNDYRPEKRVRIKSKISTYGGFKFNNLKEGDVVKIYNLNGKKIAELTDGNSKGFEWKGRKDTNNNGDWAESGTYIYQIKLKEKGKIISGTIAFVW